MANTPATEAEVKAAEAKLTQIDIEELAELREYKKTAVKRKARSKARREIKSMIFRMPAIKKLYQDEMKKRGFSPREADDDDE